ncbi:MAG: hypothetical protein H6718_07450 [Polyangiaceae bacterium]|nr:hypothetical protein [Polyangiaceae bacterium]
MYVVQISDRNTFANKVASEQLPVRVVRTPTAIPVQQGTGVVMHPGLALDYALDFDDPNMGETTWTFREVVLTNAQGEVLLTNSLLAMLPKANVDIVHRSGSL